MPGPRKKTKAKPKSKPQFSSSSRINEDSSPFMDDISNAEGWSRIVNILCDFLEIPDLTTRSGLKKVHANFENIYRRLDLAYQKNAGNEKIRGGIIGIYAKMCADSILRNKLFKEGVLSRLMPLLNMPYCRQLALRSLSTMTHHGGVEVRKEIAKKTSDLVRLMQEHPDDPKTAELSIVTMAHAVGAAINVEDKPEARLVKELNIPLMLNVVTETLRKPWVSYYLLNHVVELLASPTLHCSRDCIANPSTLTFLTASLRSKDVAFRMTALGGLVRLHGLDAEEDQRHLDPQKMIAAVQRGFPDHLSRIIMDYGAERSDLLLTLRATTDNQRAFMRCAQDRDMYVLGMTLAALITKNEFSIANGMFQTENPRTGRLEVMSDLGLPFVMWLDALPHCAKAMRAKGSAYEMDLADMVELKYLIMKSRVSDAIALAKRSIERSPGVAYFYYVVTLSADSAEGLRHAKKGMKCTKMTPFVRFAMMQRAVEHAGHFGLKLLLSSSAGDKKWEEGIAFLTSALEDGKTYVEEAPPDARHMKNVIYWYILLTLAIKGPEMSPDMHELQDTFTKLKIADEFSGLIGITPPKTQMRLVQQTVVKHYPAGVKEWGSVISRFDDLSATRAESIDPAKAEDDLAAWLDEMHLEDGLDEPHPEICTHPKINSNKVSLYRCSHCGNPSAVLRKCGGCDKTRYCDSSCQKAHWATHKTACKTSGSESRR